jgi:hypothetical protein
VSIIIIALTLVTGGGFALTSPTTMTTAFAQEGGNNTTTTQEGTTPTTSDDITITATTNTTATPSSSSGMELSPQPIWEEEATTSGMTPINQTHSIVTFIGNGTLTVPDTGQTINMTNNGTAFISPVIGSNGTVSAYGKENVFSSEDGDTTAITFHEIVHYNPTTFEGKGIVIAVFDANATSSLAPFNDMFVTGVHYEDPNAQASTITLWEWESGIGNTSGLAPTQPMQDEEEEEEEEIQGNGNAAPSAK